MLWVLKWSKKVLLGYHLSRCGSSAIVLCADMLCLPLFVVLCPKDIGPDLLTFTWNCSYPAQKMSLHAKSLLHLWKVILAYFVLTITCKWVNQNCTRPLVLNSLIQFAGTSSILPLQFSSWRKRVYLQVKRRKQWPCCQREAFTSKARNKEKWNNSVWGPRTKQQVSTGVKTVWIWKWINTYMIS